MGLYLVRRRGVDSFDRWVYSFVAMHYHSPALTAIADFGNPIVVALVGATGAVLVARRDRRRAIACLAGPLLGGVLAEYVLKPLVDPHVGGLSFPSGHTVGVSAVVVVLAIVLPHRTRVVVVALGTALGIAACYSVVALGWHSPSDAAAGIAVGSGAVLAVDGLLHVLW
ncbi:MAG: phosphatase PAP2 family protein [Deltaproteobacteria bacterium]